MRVDGFACALAVTAALFFSDAAVAQEYAAEVYPGARLDANGSSEQTVTFYSTDPVEKVLDFYGAGEKAAEDVYSRGAYIETFDRQRIHAIQTAAGWKFYELGTAGESAGVRISATKPPHPQQLAMTCGGKNAALGLMSMHYRLWGHDKAELDAACQQYGHLATAVYMMSGQQDDNGRRMDQGKVIEEELTDKVTGEAMAGVMDQQAIALKMQEAMASGDREEMQRLAREMKGASKQTGTQDNWDDAMDALARMDALDYRTRIVIHTHPSSWKKLE